MSGWFFFPCHLYQTPPLALLRQLKGLSLGWFFFPCHLYQTPPLCPVMAVKRAIPGVVLLPLSFIPDSPLCPVMAVKRAMPGVVLFPLPFIPDSPQFALLQQLKGLRALYLSGIAWLPGFRLSSLSRFSPRAFLLSQVFEKGWVLFSLPLGPRPKIMLATSSVGESAPLPFIPGFLSNLLKCLGSGIRMLCYLPYGPSCH